MMFGSVMKHFPNLRHVKRCKTCVSGLNALFQGAKVVNHPLYSIGPKMMFGSVSGHVKDAKLVFELQCSISGYQSCEASILHHWNQNDVRECYVAFR
jgi:hypothetical protein